MHSLLPKDQIIQIVFFLQSHGIFSFMKNGKIHGNVHLQLKILIKGFLSTDRFKALVLRKILFYFFSMFFYGSDPGPPGLGAFETLGPSS